jgi:arsenite-transporting ATPase
LNPKWVLDRIVTQSLSPGQGSKLMDTVIYREMGQMIHGLQEYTAYEWVTRMLTDNEYDLIVLDTPPAFHAKEFFNAPAKIRNLMESRVFQIFIPSGSSWIPSLLTFGWIEKLLGEKVYRESRMFFETFTGLRDRIIARCGKLAEFFGQRDVAVVVVGTPESTPLLELEGLIGFLEGKRIPIEAVVINQVEQGSGFSSKDWESDVSPELLGKLVELKVHQDAKADRAFESVQRVKSRHPSREWVEFPMVHSLDGFEILRQNADRMR